MKAAKLRVPLFASFFFMLPSFLVTLTFSQSSITPSASFCTGTTPCILTYHNDTNRDGVNANETRFTPSFNFSSLAATTVATDGLIYAQPLYVHGLSSSSGSVGSCASGTNVVFVATENNTIYAVNAASGSICWQHTFITGVTPETTIPYIDLPHSGGGNPCDNLAPQVGITSTPVIDASVTPPVLYVVSNHKIAYGSGPVYSQRLHAVDATSGSEFSYVDIGPALGSSFYPLVENQRPGLALSKSSSTLANVYIAWASNCDFGVSGHPYDGWVAGFQINYSAPSSGFSLLGSFTTEPTGTTTHEGGIWMAGGAPAIDSSGNVYVAVGNGDVSPPSSSSGEWGNSIIKLSSSLSELDYYTPNDYSQLDSGGAVCFYTSCPPNSTTVLAQDTDMGTAGVVLLSSSQLISVGKQGMAYLVPYSATGNGIMGGLDGGGYTASSGSTASQTDCTTSSTPAPGSIVECFQAVSFTADTSPNGIWGIPAFWSPGSSNQYLYGIGLHDYMYWYSYTSGAPGSFNPTAAAMSDHQFAKQGTTGISVGGTTSVTWDGSNSSNGLVWALDSNGFGRGNASSGTFVGSNPAQLWVYSAVPGGSGTRTALWNSTTALSSSMPGAVKFTMPTVVDGYIFVGGGSPGYFSSTSTTCPAPGTSPPYFCAGQLTILH